METPNDSLPRFSQIKFDVPAGEQSVNLAEVIAMCVHLGKLLQCVPKEKRKFAVARLLNESDNLGKQGVPLGAVMLREVAESWEDFSQ